MRYQERIYIQNDNRGVRNKDILNVNMSSDFCIFKSPTFDISGATKVQCDSIVVNFTGYTLDSILSAATANCFDIEDIACYSGTTWETKIIANDVEQYTNVFYQTNILTGDTPTDDLFLASITRGLINLGYSYIKSGSTYTIDKPYGVKTIEFDVCVSFLTFSGDFVCPSGYISNENNDGCQKIVSTAATFNGSGTTIMSGDTNTAYGVLGAYFYPNVQNNGALPVNYTNLGVLRDQTGGTINALGINNNTFFGNPSGNTTDGRLNNIGISASTTQWLGFSKCIDISSGGTYYVGLAADNFCRFKVNGQSLVTFSGGGGTGSAGRAWQVWNVFPVELNSGLNIIEMEGLNDGAATAFGAEVYHPADFNTFTAATTTGETGLLFTTKEYIGKTYEIGTTIGYSCPNGYALNTCGTAYTCDYILRTGYTSSCSATCLDNCVIVSNGIFPYIDNTSRGVYVVNSSQTTIPVSFNFTGNTSTFLDTNAQFKFEIYKYLPSIGAFKLPAIYKSETYNYSSFSGTNILNVLIPFSGLALDGDYIIKGYYEADACTDFLKRLGKRLNTVTYKNVGQYQLYDDTLDYFFVATTEAEAPKFFDTSNDGNQNYSPVSLYQQVIIVDDLPTEFVNEDTTLDNDNVLYERTGATFVLQSEYVGDIIVTLNGLVLSKDVDYSLSGQVLTFSGSIINDDIITIVYSRTVSATLVADTIFLSSTIPSGTTDSQGSSKYFYNTTTGKYEIFTKNEPLSQSKIMVMLNGVTLADNIDYYQSTSNPNRIILIGSLMVGDVLTIIYYPKATVINGITQANNYIAWYIETPPEMINGYFNLEYGTNSNFSTFNIANTVPYQIGVTNYNSILSLSGDIGTKIYYRVRNIKNYPSICGDLIQSSAVSETVSVVIQSNAINSY